MKRLIVLGLAVLMVLAGVMTGRTQTCPTSIGWGEYGYCLQSNTCGTLPPFLWFQCAQVYCEGGAFGSPCFNPFGYGSECYPYGCATAWIYGDCHCG
jgi:hypothetical protein